VTAMSSEVTEYAKLLAQTLPGVIHSKEENEHFIGILEKLERRSNEWSPAESRLAELLTLLIEEYEEENYQLKAATPVYVLVELMEANGLQPRDMADVFGDENTLSAVIAGRQDMTREHIKRLSIRFAVSPEVFF
jgi:HTH-type transcriptional regulator/antitoxin HigA